ncbi:MAG: alpha/beta hydrolase [Motiliproteus sp.]
MIAKLWNLVGSDQGPRLVYTLMEARALVEPLSLGLMAPMISARPKGDGHPVLVLPGFTAGDGETYLLRQFLKSHNYRVYAWKMGRNVGPMVGLEKRISEKVRALADEHGTPVTLIGWSLGGLFARSVAHQMPELVRSVISLGSPLGVGRGGRDISPLITLLGSRVVASEFLAMIDDKSLSDWNHTPPVPTTAIYSQTDGAAHWGSTCDPLEHARSENVRVPGSHCGLTHNAFVYSVLADRLAQPEGDWQPFSYLGISSLYYRLFEPFKGIC